jgi:hypothetical protein
MLTKVARLLIAIGLLAGFTVGWASQLTGEQVITVCPQGPQACQFSKIQEAINTAPDGSTILISPGTYIEQGELKISKNVNLLGSEPRFVQLIASRVSIEGLVQVLVSGLTIFGAVSIYQAQVTFAHVGVVGSIGVDRTETDTKPLQHSQVNLINVRVLWVTSNIHFALGIGPSAEVRVTRSEFVADSSEVVSVLGQLVMSNSLIRGIGLTTNGLVAGSGAKAQLLDTQIEIPIASKGFIVGGVVAFEGSDLVLQRVKIFSIQHGVLAKNARLHLEESHLLSINGWGLALMVETCGMNLPLDKPPPQTYEGLIIGRQNEITGARELGDVCPSELEFLKTSEGGQYP